MKNPIKIYCFLLLMLFSLPGFSAQAVKHHKKQPVKKQVYHRSKRESRMQMQLRQGRLHEQQAKEVDKIQKKIAKEQQGQH